jgi:hypothetical protein
MSEAFSWPEGNLYLITGSATASALLGYVKSLQLNPFRGWENYQTLDGTWHNRQTGRRIDVSVSLAHTVDNAILDAVFDASHTAVHLHHVAAYTGVSAGCIMYSGVIDTLSTNGNEGDLFVRQFTYHCNNWSAY